MPGIGVLWRGVAAVAIMGGMMAPGTRAGEPGSAPPATPEALAGRQMELCMIGDSITWWGQGDWFRRYLLDELPELAFIGTHTASLGYGHAGEGGNNTRQILDRLDAVPDSRYYHVLAGVNDNAAALEDTVAAVAGRTFDNLVRIVRSLAARPDTDKVFLGSLLPCCPDGDPASEAMRYRDAANQEVNRLFRERWTEVFPDSRVVWVEYEQPLRARDDWRTVIRLHPRREGYRLLAGLLAAALKAHARPDDQGVGSGAAGVVVENLWRAAEKATTPLIPGAYVVSFDAPATPPPGSIRLRALNAEALKETFDREVTLRATRDGRWQGVFETSQPAYGAMLAMTGVDGAERIMVEKMRPSREASSYGTGVFVDRESPVSAGERMVDAGERAVRRYVGQGEAMMSSFRNAAMAATLAIATAAAGEPAMPETANMLKNADFAQPSRDWRMWGATRGLTAEDRAAFLTYVKDESLDKTVLQLRETSVDSRVYVIQRVDLSGPPEKGYALAFRAKAEAGAKLSGGIMYNTVGEDGKEKYLMTDSAILTGTGDWADYTVVCRRTPAAASRLYVFLDPTDSKASSTGEARFSDVRLTPSVTSP